MPALTPPRNVLLDITLLRLYRQLVPNVQLANTAVKTRMRPNVTQATTVQALITVFLVLLELTLPLTVYQALPCVNHACQAILVRCLEPPIRQHNVQLVTYVLEGLLHQVLKPIRMEECASLESIVPQVLAQAQLVQWESIVLTMRGSQYPGIVSLAITVRLAKKPRID